MGSKEPKPNDTITHNIHGHRIVEEYTKEGVIVSLWTTGENPELVKQSLTWEDKAPGLAEIIQLAKERNRGKPNIEGVELTTPKEEE